MLKYFFLLVVLSVLPLPVLAQEGCESFPDIPVQVTPVFDEAKYDFNTDIVGIRALLDDTQHSIQENHDRLPLGVTHYEPMMEFRLPVKVITYPDGLSCAQVQSAAVTMGYKNVTVYIADEVPQDSCGFNQIMAHEQKHIAVNQQVLQKYMPLIEGQMKDYLRLNGVFREENADYAVSVLRGKLQEILNGLGQQMTEDNRSQQRLVDSPEEYRRLTNSCNGQLANIALRFWDSHR